MANHTTKEKGRQRISEIVFDALERKEKREFEEEQEGKRDARSLEQEVQLLQAEGVDETAKEAASGATNAGQSASKPPPLAKIGVGAAGGNLEKVLGAVQDVGEEKIVDTPGDPSSGGLPSRTISSTTTQDTSRPFGGQTFDLFRLLSGNDEFATIKGQRSSTNERVNPEFTKAKKDRTSAIALMAHSVQRGQTSAHEFVPFVNQQLDGFTPEERAQVNVDIKRKTSELQVQQGEIDRTQAFNIAKQFRADGVPIDPQLVKQLSSSTGQGMVEGLKEYEKRFQAAPKQVRAENVANMQEQLAENSLELSERKLSADNANQEANFFKLERDGVFVDNGAVSDLSEKQSADGLEDLIFKKAKDGSRSLDINEDLVPAYQRYVEADLAGWRTMRMPIPDLTTGFNRIGKLPEGHWMRSQDKVQQLEPQDAYHHVQRASGQGLTNSGQPTLDPSKIDVVVTDRAIKSSIDWLNLNGYDAILDARGDANITVDPNHPYSASLARLLNITRDTLTTGERRGATIFSPQDQRGFAGTAQVGSIANTALDTDRTNVSKEFFAGIVEADRKAANEERARKISELNLHLR